MTQSILAHAGHGHLSSSSLTHYLLEPVHLPMLIVVMLVVFALMRFWLDHKARRALRERVRR